MPVGKAPDKAGVKLGDAFVDIHARLTDAERRLKRFEKDVNKEGKKAGRAYGRGFAIAVKAFVGSAILRGAINIISNFTGAASRMEESINAVNVVFGKAAKSIHEFSKTTADSVGLARSEFNQMTTVTGALLKATERPLNEVADLTIEMTKKGADLASVFNTDVKDAMEALNAALRGETEPIRRYAVDVTDATLQTFLLSQGIKTKVRNLTQAQKTLVRYAAIMKQTEAVQGDFTNTADSAANVGRRLASAWEEFKATVSKELLPVLADIGLELKNMIQSGDAKAFGEAIAEGVTVAVKVTRELWELLQFIVPKLQSVGRTILNIIEKGKFGGAQFGIRVAEPKSDFPFPPVRQDDKPRATSTAQQPTTSSADILSGLTGDRATRATFGMGQRALQQAQANAFSIGGRMAVIFRPMKKTLEEIPPVAEKIRTVFDDTAHSLGQMVAHGAKLKDIFLRLAATSIPLFVGGPVGQLLSGFVGGLGAHSGGTFAHGRKTANFRAGGVVPAGFPNDSFAMFFESGEKVRATPAARAGDEAMHLAKISSGIQSQTEALVMAMRKYQAQVSVSQQIEERGLQLAVERSQRREARFR